MKKSKMALPLLSLLACIPSQALATAVLGQSLQSLSILSNSYATTGASSTIFGSLMAGDVGTSGAGGYISGNFTTVGAATIGAGGSTVGGNITAGGAMTTGDSAVVGGNITAGGAATVGASSVVSGNVAAAGAVSTGAASQVAGNIASGGAASIGTGALVGGTVAAVGAVTQGVGSSVPSQTVIVTPPVDAGVLVAGLADQAASNRLQVLAAQAAFARMVTTDFLGATITADTTLFSGVYGAASLTTTAGTTITLDGQNRTGQFWVFNIGDILSTGELSRVVLINGATADSVVWNSGGYASLGADSLFVGTLVASASASISVGANAAATDTGSSCGGLFSALSFISVGAGARIGSNGCSGVAKSFQIDGNGMAYHEAPAPTDIAQAPEPSTWALLVLGFGLVGLSLRRKPFPVIAA